MEEEQKKKELKEKLRLLRVNALEHSKTTLKALQRKNSYKFTRAGKTKRS